MEIHEGVDGHYIHRLNEHGHGTRCLLISPSQEDDQEWVHADDFMVMQKERDDLRRALSLLNAYLWVGGVRLNEIAKILERVDMTEEMAKATLGIINAVRKGEL